RDNLRSARSWSLRSGSRVGAEEISTGPASVPAVAACEVLVPGMVRGASPHDMALGKVHVRAAGSPLDTARGRGPAPIAPDRLAVTAGTGQRPGQGPGRGGRKRGR